MSTTNKAAFLRTEFPSLLSSLDPNTERKWGKMDAQQMVEHMSYSMRQANGRDLYECVTPEEHLPKMQAFLMSEKPFRENTPNVLIGDDTVPHERANIADAITELREEIDHFFEVFDSNPNKKIMNPFFGELNYEMWVQLLHKHAWHHLNQFGIQKED
ncbi:MAG: hypothetical protein R2800_14350 [Flavipsychrobacter sp.]